MFKLYVRIFVVCKNAFYKITNKLFITILVDYLLGTIAKQSFILQMKYKCNLY